MGRGIVGHINEAKPHHYDEFSLYDLEAVLEELGKKRTKSGTRGITLHTGQKGFEDFEMNMNRQLDVERFQGIFPKHTNYTSFDFGELPLTELEDFIKDLEE